MRVIKGTFMCCRGSRGTQNESRVKEIESHELRDDLKMRETYRAVITVIASDENVSSNKHNVSKKGMIASRSEG